MSTASHAGHTGRAGRLVLGLGLALLAGCGALPSAVTTTPGGISIDTRYNSKGQDSRVHFLILHHTVADLPISIKVLTGQDVSPQFEQDPGPRCPWKLRADLGIAPPWPDAARVAERQALYQRERPDIRCCQEKLAQHGHAVAQSGALDEQMLNVMMNFQMRYRPSNHSGVPDAESAAILWALNNPVKP